MERGAEAVRKRKKRFAYEERIQMTLTPYAPDHNRTRADILAVAANGILCRSWTRELITTGKYGYDVGLKFGGWSNGPTLYPFSYFLTKQQKNQLRQTRRTQGLEAMKKLREKFYAEIRRQAETVLTARGIASKGNT